MSKTALIFHPYKPIRDLDNLNGFSHEMRFLADYLYEKKNYAEVRLHTGGIISDDYDELWLSCFQPEDNKPVFIPRNKPIYYVLNDPDFFFVPHELKSYDITYLFCGEDWELCKSLLPEPPMGYFLPQETNYLPLWPYMFSKYTRPKSEKIEDFTYALSYLGYTRSSYRHQRLDKLLDNNLHSLVIGYNKKLKNDFIDYFPKTPVPKAYSYAQKAVAQLVVGDTTYPSLFPRSHRLLQSLILSPFVFVDGEIGANVFEGYPLLQDNFIVYDPSDIEKTMIRLIQKGFFMTAKHYFDKFYLWLTKF